MKEIKKEYITPEIEISKFNIEDSITTSNMGGNLPGDQHGSFGDL